MVGRRITLYLDQSPGLRVKYSIGWAWHHDQEARPGPRFPITMDCCSYDQLYEGSFDAPLKMSERFPKVLVTWTCVRCSNDDRSLVPVHCMLGSGRGGDRGKLCCCIILYFFVSLLFQSNSSLCNISIILLNISIINISAVTTVSSTPILTISHHSSLLPAPWIFYFFVTFHSILSTFIFFFVLFLFFSLRFFVILFLYFFWHAITNVF